MFAEIITIGDEILIGQIVDTNSAYLSKALNKIGVQVYQITSVQDCKKHILQALQTAKTRADLVLVTGGLGPTKDDITKQCLCHFFNDKLIEDKEVLAHIKKLFYKHIAHPPLPSNLAQAQVPSKATVLFNLHGTAPGLWMEQDSTIFIFMPGVPYEMKHLMEFKVLPKITNRFTLPFIFHKTLLTHGMGESAIANRIKEWEANLPKHIKLAYLPSLGKVRLRLSSKGVNKEILQNEVNNHMNQLHNLLLDSSIGYEGETSVLQQIKTLLQQNSKTLSLAESCTGGAIAQEITKFPGVSSFYRGGVVAYATDLKVSVLKIDPQFISKHKVVSIPVAETMARQACKVFSSDYAIATTGIAGPSQGGEDQKIGTVCISIATPNGVISDTFLFGKDRESNIKKATNKALELLLKEISKN